MTKQEFVTKYLLIIVEHEGEYRGLEFLKDLISLLGDNGGSGVTANVPEVPTPPVVMDPWPDRPEIHKFKCRGGIAGAPIVPVYTDPDLDSPF